MYNCAHLRSTKESLTVEYLKRENIFFCSGKGKGEQKCILHNLPIVPFLHSLLSLLGLQRLHYLALSVESGEAGEIVDRFPA